MKTMARGSAFVRQVFVKTLFLLLLTGFTCEFHPALALDYLPVGTQVGTFHLDYDYSGYTPGVSTLPSNLGVIGGMVRLPDGDMALNIGSNLSSDHRKYIYIFHFDLTLDPPYTITKGPLIPRYPAVAEQIFYGRAVTYIGNNQIALMGSWSVDLGGGNYEAHAAMFSMNLAGDGEVVKMADLPTTSADGGGFYDMAYLPAVDQEPEGWAFTRGGSSGYDWRYWVTTLGNYSTPIHEIPAASIHLEPNGSLLLANLNDGDFLSLGSVEGHSRYSLERNYIACTRFNRLGQYKGMWLVGRAFQDSGVDYSLGPFGELANGDIVTGTGWQSIHDSEASSYHYYIIRPPTGAGAPIIVLNTDVVSFRQTHTGSTATTTMTISNAGSSNLIVSKFEFTGEDGSRFGVTPPIPLDIAPGYGFPGPESSRQIQLTFSPQGVGDANAQLQIYSNDPTQNKVRVFLSGFGYSPLLSTDRLSTISQACMPDFSRVNAMHFTPDGSRLLLCISTNAFDWTWNFRSFRTLRGADCRLTGLDLTTYTEHLVMPRGSFSEMPMTIGQDGTLWAAPWGLKQVIQVRADGARFDQAVPGGATASYLDLTPDGTALLMSVSPRLMRYPLTKNEAGFWILGAGQPLPYTFEDGIYLFCQGARPDGRFDLYLNGRKHLIVPAGFFAGEPFAGDPAEFWENVQHYGDCIDPMTNDLLYCDQTSLGNVPVGIMRRTGTHALFASPLARSRLFNILLSPGLAATLTTEQTGIVDTNHDGKLDVADLISLVNAEKRVLQP